MFIGFLGCLFSNRHIHSYCVSVWDVLVCLFLIYLFFFLIFIYVAGSGLGCSRWVYLLWGTWDLSSPTGDWTCVLCIRRQILNRWTPREVPVEFFVYSGYQFSALRAAILFPHLSWSFPPPVLCSLRCGFAPCRCLSEGRACFPTLDAAWLSTSASTSVRKPETAFRPAPCSGKDRIPFPPSHLLQLSLSVCLFFGTVITNHHQLGDLE